MRWSKSIASREGLAARRPFEYRPRSCALDSSCIAAALRIVHLQVAGLSIGEESLEQIGSLGAFAHFGIDHHVLRVEGADSQESRREHIWDTVDRLEGSIGDLAHVDGMGRAVGRVCRLVLKVKKKKLLTKSSMLHAHATWHAWIVGNDMARSPLTELGVRHSEQRTELIRRKPKNAE